MHHDFSINPNIVNNAMCRYVVSSSQKTMVSSIYIYTYIYVHMAFLLSLPFAVSLFQCGTANRALASSSQKKIVNSQTRTSSTLRHINHFVINYKILPLKLLHPCIPPNLETQILRYKFQSKQNLKFNVYGVATSSRLLKIICLFCKRAL